ncbi:S-layer homology domain-containing protein [Paenibacillus sp. GCM10027626]|uniref:S-layer homology domain-containing protein n=1 Tax=Paenibacillus sp. GCM10027626 TaxID=3273411 RepID=UPI00363F67DF
MMRLSAIAQKVLPGAMDEVLRISISKAKESDVPPHSEWSRLSPAFNLSKQIPAWASQAVAQALKANIVQGYGDGSFRPYAQITRTEMIAMATRALNLPMSQKAVTSCMYDADIPVWAKSLVAEAAARGIVKGRSGNRFAPGETSARVEVVTIIMRVIQ